MGTKRTGARLHLLTARQVQVAPEGDHSDGGGLMLRVTGGSSTWVYRFTSPAGRRREMGLGVAMRGSAAQAGETLVAARRLAHEARELLARGVDPIDDRERRREAARAAEDTARQQRQRERWTLARAARDYHERVIETKRTAKHARQWIASLENHVPADVWHCPIADITAPALLAALAGMHSLETKGEAVPETQTRVRQRLESIFEDAVFHDRCTTNPAAAIRRKLAEHRGPRSRRAFKALPYREAPAFAARLAESDAIAARCLEFAMLTAARTGEVLGATWAEVDLDAALWVVPAARMKAGRRNGDHTVYLSPRAVELLRKVRALALGDAWVFPSPTDPAMPLSNMAMLALLDRMKVRDRTTVHGLRRATFSTWANETGAARPDVIEAVLAHEEANRVRAAYNRAQFAEERRALLAAWAAFLGAPTASNVVPLRAA